ncbi:hypothetical protein [Deinococcus hopiensis]|nr:hypothetical protein [Deinococcus hopiensis]
MKRLSALLILALLGTGASATTAPLTLRVEAVCVPLSVSAESVTVKCTRGSQAPADPRGFAGVPLGTWHLSGHGSSADGAELFTYRALESAANHVTFY